MQLRYFGVLQPVLQMFWESDCQWSCLTSTLKHILLKLTHNLHFFTEKWNEYITLILDLGFAHNQGPDFDDLKMINKIT